MSTYDALELRVKRRLGRRGFTVTTEFLDEMIAAQELLEKMGALPKFLRTTTSNKVTLKDLVILTDLPPTNFIKVYDDQALVYDDEDGKERLAIRLDTRNQLISKKNAGISGEIFYFIASNTEIEVAPKLSRDTTFRLTYYAKDTVLDGNNTNAWCANEPDQIMGMAGVELAVWLRDDRALRKFQQQAQSARRTMINQIEGDEWGDQDLTMGGPD